MHFYLSRPHSLIILYRYGSLIPVEQIQRRKGAKNCKLFALKTRHKTKKGNQRQGVRDDADDHNGRL